MKHHNAHLVTFKQASIAAAIAALITGRRSGIIKPYQYERGMKQLEKDCDQLERGERNYCARSCAV